MMNTLDHAKSEYFSAVAEMHRAKANLAEAKSMLGDLLPEDRLTRLRAEVERTTKKFERLRDNVRSLGGQE